MIIIGLIGPTLVLVLIQMLALILFTSEGPVQTGGVCHCSGGDELHRRMYIGVSSSSSSSSRSFSVSSSFSVNSSSSSASISSSSSSITCFVMKSSANSCGEWGGMERKRGREEERKRGEYRV